MNKLKPLSIFIAGLLLAIGAKASDTGLINHVSFASNSAETVRSGTAQFSIAGGFSTDNCNNVYAAVSGNDPHMISLLLSAQAQNREVEVHLDSSADSKYYGNRCLVSYLVVN